MKMLRISALLFAFLLVAVAVLAEPFTITMEEGRRETFVLGGKNYDIEVMIIEDATPPTVTFKINGQVIPQLIENQSFVLRDAARIFIVDIWLNEAGETGGGDKVTFTLFYCGDNVCDISETCSVCGADCGCQKGYYCREMSPRSACLPIVCGDYWCSPEETCEIDSCCNGVRVDLGRDKNNCGACGNACKEQNICSNSVCQSPNTPALEKLQCTAKVDCDDHDACTLDVCQHGQCSHTALPDCHNYATYGGEIEVEPRGDDEYSLKFENREGIDYKIPYLTNENGKFKYGDDDRDLVFIEAQFAENMTVEQVRQTKNLFNIGVLDYFVVSSMNDSSGHAGNALTHIVRYNSIDVVDRMLSFDEEGSGAKKFTYELINLPNAAALGKARLIFGGNAYTAYIGNTTASGNGYPGYPLAIDMNGDGSINRAEISLTNRASGVLDLGNAEESDGGTFTYAASEHRFSWTNAGDTIAADLAPFYLITPEKIHRNTPPQNEHVAAVFERREENRLGIAAVKGSNFILGKPTGGRVTTNYAVAFDLAVPCCNDSETFSVQYLPEIQIQTRPEIGKSINITLTDPAFPLTSYILMMALGTKPGYALDDGRVIPLNSTPQSGLHDSLYWPAKLGLVNSQSTLDANGQATAVLNIPDIPALEGATFSIAFITVDKSKPLPYAVLNISYPESFTIDA